MYCGGNGNNFNSGIKVGAPTASGDPLDMSSKAEVVPTICTTCRRVKCPIMDLVPQPKASVDRHDADGPAASSICPICMQAANRRGRHVAKFRREVNLMRNEGTAVRFTNLPEITCKRDVYNLVRAFGLIAHVDDPQLDENAISCSKFASVKFFQRHDAEEAVSILNGYSYGDCTIRAECIAPGSEKVSAPSPICAVCMEAVDASVRVKNLPEDTCEHDLYNLFCRFGIVNKLWLTLEKTEAGLGRKLGVVQFLQRDDAKSAITLLDGYIYGGLNLQVNCAMLSDLLPSE